MDCEIINLSHTYNQHIADFDHILCLYHNRWDQWYSFVVYIHFQHSQFVLLVDHMHFVGVHMDQRVLDFVDLYIHDVALVVGHMTFDFVIDSFGVVVVEVLVVCKSK